jgi:tRNA nucleotidyltransferase (CCA-adding enzyme)
MTKKRRSGGVSAKNYVLHIPNGELTVDDESISSLPLAFLGNNTMNIPPQVLTVCRLLTEAGHQAYLVGGCVRDTLMGLEPKDWDIATSALPAQVLALPCKTIPTGEQYGTITCIVEGVHVEVTTFRKDSPITDGRRPESVTFGCTLEEDLARRDFTCNAIAYNPVNSAFFDPFGGRFDIQKEILCAVGEHEERFREDALRMLRAIRFVCTKGFRFDYWTERALHECSDLITSVSKERVRDELLKILASPRPTLGLMHLGNSGLLEFICPELLKGIGMHQNTRWHAYEVWDHVMSCLKNCESPDPIICLAVLLHDIAKPATREPHPKEPGQFRFLEHEEVGAKMAADWMREYKFSNEEIQKVSHLIRHHLIHYESKWSNAQVRRWVRNIGKENIADVLAVAKADLLGKGYPCEDRLQTLAELETRAYAVQDQIVQPGSGLAIGGKEVMELLGITSGGPVVGRCLKHLAEAVLEDPEVNTEEDLMRLVKEWTSKDKENC